MTPGQRPNFPSATEESPSPPSAATPTTEAAMDTERKVDVLAWQPIDTAPRNGMPILLWAEVDGGDIGCGFTAVRASWHTSEGEHDIFGSEGGWLVSFTMGSNICSAEGATHWMPLPAKPGSK